MRIVTENKVRSPKHCTPWNYSYAITMSDVPIALIGPNALYRCLFGLRYARCENDLNRSALGEIKPHRQYESYDRSPFWRRNLSCSRRKIIMTNNKRRTFCILHANNLLFISFKSFFTEELVPLLSKFHFS